MPKVNLHKDRFLGYLCKQLNPRYLPTNKDVLRCYSFLRKNEWKQQTKQESGLEVSRQIQRVYNNLNIPTIKVSLIHKKLIQLYTEFQNSCIKNANKDPLPALGQAFIRTLDQPFNLRAPETKKNPPPPPPKPSNSYFQTVSLENYTISSSEDESDDEFEFDCVLKDPDFKPKLIKAAKKIRIIDKNLASSTDRTGSGDRSVFRIGCDILNSLDIPLNRVVFSPSSIYRERLKEEAKHLDDLKSNLVFPDYSTLHFDGVNIYHRKQRKSHHYLCVAVSGPDNFRQLLEIVEIESESGLEYARRLLDIVQDWNILNKIKFIQCDTTALNSGHMNGAIVQFTKLIADQLEQVVHFTVLYCRHHIYQVGFCKVRTIFRKIPNFLSYKPSL